MDRFVAVDVEIASRSPLCVCAIGAVRIELGHEIKSYHSLVHVNGPVRFARVHGITAADLADAPPWPTVWAALLDLLGDIHLLVAFRASFDRGAILAMCANHGIRPPPLRFDCAAAMIEAHYGRRLDLRAALDALGLPFPGRPHDPLADARAAAAIALACAHNAAPSWRHRCAIPLSESHARRDPARDR